MPWGIVYYRAGNGVVPAQQFLLDCPTSMRAKLLRRRIRSPRSQARQPLSRHPATPDRRVAAVSLVGVRAEHAACSDRRRAGDEKRWSVRIERHDQLAEHFENPLLQHRVGHRQRGSASCPTWRSPMQLHDDIIAHQSIPPRLTTWSTAPPASPAAAAVDRSDGADSLLRTRGSAVSRRSPGDRAGIVPQ